MSESITTIVTGLASYVGNVDALLLCAKIEEKERKMNISEEQIARLSREEKIQLMETLWIALSRSDEDVKSPSWHEDCLRETEARYLAGEEPVLDWEDAKRELWNRVA